MFSPLQPTHAMTNSLPISHIPRNSSSSQYGNNSFRTDLVRFVCLYEFVPGIFFVPPESIRLGTAELIRRGIDSEGDRFHINAIRVNIGNCIWGESCFLPELIRRGSDSPQPNPYKATQTWLGDLRIPAGSSFLIPGEHILFRFLRVNSFYCLILIIKPQIWCTIIEIVQFLIHTIHLDARYTFFS